MKDCAVYVRLSVRDEEADEVAESIRRQRADGTDWAQAHGYNPVIYEEGVGLHSARHEKNRPAFLKMKADILAGKLAAVWVADFSRANRNALQFLAFVDLVIKHEVLLVSQAEHIDCTTAAGRAFLTVLAAFNQFYSENIGEKQKNAVASIKRHGGTVGRIPLGLVRDPLTRKFHADDRGYENGHGQILWLDVVRRFFELYSDPRQIGVKTVIDDLDAQGMRWRRTSGEPRPIQTSDLYGLLETCESYRGVLPDELLDATMRRYAMRRFRRDNGARIKYAKSLLWHLLYCPACGARYSQNGPRSYAHGYPKCELNGRTAHRILDEQVWEILEDKVVFTKAQKAQLMKRSGRTTTDRPGQVLKLTGKRERLKELYIDGRFGKLEYEKRDRELASRIQAIVTELPLTAVEVERTTEEIENIVKHWREGANVKPDIANALLREMIERIYVRRKRIENIVWKPPFDKLFD